MRASIPILQDYDVSPVTGFLPDTLPLKRLPDSYYEPWEAIIENLPALILTRKVRMLVDRMPLLTTDRLKSEAEWQRSVSILAFIAHGYVWAGDEPRDHLPTQLAKPWLEASAHFDLPPICSYAGVCLWNHKTIYPVDPAEWHLDNLATLSTFTGSIDESWFYLVSTAIERQGAPCLTTGLSAIQGCRDNDPKVVVENLQALAEAIDALTTTLMRMFEMCDPHTFYFRLRPYLAGWKNMGEAGLPNGVRYGDETEYRQISGGSNAQSSLIQALDILLNVEHHPTGHRSAHKNELPTANPDKTKRSREKTNNFLLEMRKYMPIKHRQFLEHLEQVAEIRDYVVSHGEQEPALILSYDACLAMLRNFRDKHIQIVSRYIIIQSREAEKQKQQGSNLTKREGLATATASGPDKKKVERGTGGTALIPFLKQARDETGDPAAGTWGRRILSESRQTGSFTTTVSPKRASNAISGSDDSSSISPEAPSAMKRLKSAVFGSSGPEKGNIPEKESKGVVGLAGSWKPTKDQGGIPHW